MTLQRQARWRLAVGVLGALALGLAACGGESPSSDASVDTGGELSSDRTMSATALSLPLNTEGRLLASNCFQCHGTLGLGGFEEIRGKSANELLEFQTKVANRDIMAAHAQGYTPAQLRKIAAYLQQ
jgi:cytochrome c553